MSIQSADERISTGEVAAEGVAEVVTKITRGVAKGRNDNDKNNRKTRTMVFLQSQVLLRFCRFLFGNRTFQKLLYG